MEIKKAKIYGFGKWVDFDIQFHRGICIFGENESGKSTIHQFILFMLFGLPPKQREFFQPKNGAELGGRLTLHDEEVGEITIERFHHIKNGAAVCYTPDGMEYDESWLKERLKGTTLEVYQSIYSFSALDLSGISKMTKSELSEMILGIGLTGFTEIYQLEKQLETKIGELFKPNGKKPIINQQLETLDKRLDALMKYKESESTYRDKKLKSIQLENEIIEVDKKLENEKKRHSIMQKWLQALPLLKKYRIYEEQMRSLDKNILFPENGIERYEKWKESVLPLESERAVLKDNEEKYRVTLRELQDNLLDKEITGRMEAFIREKEDFLAAEKECQRIERVIANKRFEMEAELSRLQIDLELEDLYYLSLPFHQEKIWTEIKKEAENLEKDQEQLLTELQQVKHERNLLYNRIENVEEHLLSEASLSELNNKLDRLRELDTLKKVNKESENKQLNWNRKKRQKEKSINLLFIGSIVLAITMSILGWILQEDLILVIGAIVLLLGVGQWHIRKKAIKEMEEFYSLNPPKHSPISYSNEEIAEIEKTLVEHHKNVSEMENLKERLEENNLKRVQLQDRMKELEKKEQKVKQKSNAQTDEYPFLQSIDVAYWPELYHPLKQLISTAKSYLQEIGTRDTLQENMNDYKRQIDEFFQERNWKQLDQVSEQFNWIETLLQEQYDVSRKINHYEELLKENKAKQQEILKRMEVYRKEKEALFDFANVSTEEAYYERASEIQRKMQVETELQNIKFQLERIFPNESWKEYARDEVTETELELRTQKLEQKIIKLEQKKVSLEKDIAKLESQLEMMESETNYSDHLHQYELEKEELNKLAKQWAVLKVSRDVLKESKQMYQAKHLQNIIDKTSSYFQTITENKYIKIYPPSDNKEFQVETKEGIRFTVNELSKGTMDQLYVSLRLAIGQIMSEKSQLPFIIDDAFLHYDSIRSKRIMGILEEISLSRQVILFTCREEIVNATTHLERVDLNNCVRIL